MIEIHEEIVDEVVEVDDEIMGEMIVDYIELHG
jgi:hypothetical protein